MAGGAALGAVFGEGFAVFHYTVKDVGSKALMFKQPFLKGPESKLGGLAPTVNDINRLSVQLDLPQVETKSLIEQMKKGKKLVHKWIQSGRQSLKIGLQWENAQELSL